jgi:hypothetical protein
MLSEVIYSPNGRDVVVHQVGLKSEQRIKGKITGPDGFIAQTPAQYAGFCRSLFGEGVPKVVNADFKFITGKPSYAIRLNKLPCEKDKGVVVLGVSINDRFDLYAYDVIGSSRPAFGVCARKIS